MTTWSEFRTSLRRTVLQDVSEPFVLSNEVLLDAFVWATQTFCEHTALATGVTYTGATATEYTLPGDVYGTIDITGAVSLTQNGKIAYLNPSRIISNDYQTYSPYTAKAAFYTRGDKLCLTEAPTDANAILQVDYFTYYPTPSSAEAVLTIPRWAEGALAYLSGAYALLSLAVQSANIRQWLEEPERGSPESNSLRVQSDWMIKKYQQMISVHPKQDRENFFRSLT